MNDVNKQPSGYLTVVGVGIALGQTTLEAKAHIEQADKVYYLVSNPTAIRWLELLNVTSESLYSAYEIGKPRMVSYEEMVERMLASVRQGLGVCAAFYGHPGIFAYPGHKAIKIARREGYTARMLPGVSAEDYLFAELGIDPSLYGCQSFEATDFLISSPVFDPASMLVLWQVGVVGDTSFQPKSKKLEIGIELLLERLLPEYGSDHVITIFEGTMFPVCESKILRMPLGHLRDAELNAVSTLYIPPCRPGTTDVDVIRQFGMDQD
ncbi:Uroporphyrin-III C/tetrapyrrole (Corrin/Porphyrin) methyltransferase [Beggiatoa sp. PS]|nr:Uroporphyrin-III C/tetrapyrrole (Corrin/Porphyrin) methyltransferase [Beggiatoa sp. PS]